MLIKQPKNSDRYYWTQHVFRKMLQYRISEQMVRRVIRNPHRVEEGIAPGTIAVMQTRGTKKKHEVWVMYIPRHNVGGRSKLPPSPKLRRAGKDQSSKNNTAKVKIITAWRYPGVSPRRQAIPIPQDIIEELSKSFS